MRVCFWSTTFQADNHALADHLARVGWSVTVALPGAERFAREPVLRLRPFAGRLLDRDEPTTKAALGREDFDLVVVDNHVPSYDLAPHLFVLWHGFGWRVDDLSTTKRELKKLVGDVTVSNENFRFQAFGEWDREYRVRHSRLAPENVVALGSAFSDWLRPASPMRADLDNATLQPFYSIDVSNPVVLLGLTWHHGGSLGHWGDEERLLSQLIEHIAARGASTLMRMHDRHRYSEQYQQLVERLAARHRGKLMLKWKSEAPDSLVDLLVSDVCVSNYSSLLNAFYYTERPSIHIDPHDASAAQQTTFTMFLGKPMPRSVAAPDELWKLPPDENGGLRARSFPELLAQVERALAHPACCEERSRDFVSRYITAADGGTCTRMERYLEAWLSA